MDCCVDDVRVTPAYIRQKEAKRIYLREKLYSLGIQRMTQIVSVGEGLLANES